MSFCCRAKFRSYLVSVFASFSLSSCASEKAFRHCYDERITEKSLSRHVELQSRRSFPGTSLNNVLLGAQVQRCFCFQCTSSHKLFTEASLCCPAAWPRYSVALGLWGPADLLQMFELLLIRDSRGPPLQFQSSPHLGPRFSCMFMSEGALWPI